MADNLNIKGIESDDAARRPRARGKRKKPFIIEWKINPPKNKELASYHLRFWGWSVWGRYETAVRRDQAYAALVKKKANRRQEWEWMGTEEYRRIDPGRGGGTGPF